MGNSRAVVRACGRKAPPAARWTQGTLTCPVGTRPGWDSIPSRPRGGHATGDCMCRAGGGGKAAGAAQRVSGGCWRREERAAAVPDA